MDSRFRRCLEERRLVKLDTIPKDIIKKELEGAGFDLKSAERSLEEENYKWATVQAYYAAFHTSKALVLGKGYKEKSHFCLEMALKVLYIDANILETTYLRKFKECMDLREDADYGLIYSEKSAKEMTEWARKFLEKTRHLLRKTL